MEILIIGNGFDLEHDLPTTYSDFLNFCKRASRIYTYDENVSSEEYYQKNLEDWIMAADIKRRLADAFDNRNCNQIYDENGSYDLEVITSYKVLDELYTHIKCNAWLEYFLACPSFIGDNWIDFETEISRIIQTLSEARVMINNGGLIQNIQGDKGRILISFLNGSKGALHNIRDVKAIDDYAGFLNIELDRLIRALEIYIAEFVGGIKVIKRSLDIEKLRPDHVLSFNYSDTYERVYGIGKNIKYDYIHGKADINKNVISSNLVLGIDEYLDDNRKDKELEFLTFKKFYQRMYKSTGNAYLDWMDEIKDGYTDYLKKESDAYAGIVEAFKDGSFDRFPLQKSVYTDLLDIESPKHILYIFGHSLDVTDKDILKLLICNENVQTKIFYFRKNKDDKKVLGKLIRNLIQIMGQDELVRRTGGAHKTIEFIPQALPDG